MSANINLNSIGHVRIRPVKATDRVAELQRAIVEARRTGDLAYAVELREELESLISEGQAAGLEPEPEPDYPVHRFVDILRKSRIKSHLEGSNIILEHPCHMHLVVSALVLGRLIPIATMVASMPMERVQLLSFVNYPAVAHLDANNMVTRIELLSL